MTERQIEKISSLKENEEYEIRNGRKAIISKSRDSSGRDSWKVKVPLKTSEQLLSGSGVPICRRFLDPGLIQEWIENLEQNVRQDIADRKELEKLYEEKIKPKGRCYLMTAAKVWGSIDAGMTMWEITASTNLTAEDIKDFLEFRDAYSDYKDKFEQLYGEQYMPPRLATEMNRHDFEMKKEHLLLMEHLCFCSELDTGYSDPIAPAINLKRPFGNSGTIESVADILCMGRNEDGDLAPEAYTAAKNLLAELPVALEIVMTQRTFKPGIYSVSQYGAWFGYATVKNYFAVQPAIAEVIRKGSLENTNKMHGIEGICKANSTDDPWNYPIKEMSRWNPDDEFMQMVISVFKKHRDRYREKERKNGKGENGNG